ncbi:MAG: N-acetylmuramoyl-L-alanine amidase [Coriobacteriia bacterium]|nr:N-acetylmuramoyl-L-alanine amidase [Coriobacteriia bacterium]
MARSRVARRSTKRERTKKNVTWLTVAIGAVAVVALGAAIAVAAAGVKSAAVDGSTVDISEEILAGGNSEDLAPTAVPDAATALIEVPDVCGMQLEEAETLLAVAGFSVLRVSTPAGDAVPGTVLTQDPQAGSKIGAGSDVSLVYADPEGVEEQASTGTNASTGLVVCIDPGHQSQANLDPEPIGPGSNEMKPKVTGGATGAVTKQHEYQLAFAISLKIKERLEAKGVNVVMTRVSDAVDISNRQRAEAANKVNAALFVRVHADGSTNGDIKGISTLYPSGNSWVAPIEARSLRAAKLVQAAVVNATKAQDRGLSARGDIAGFNWSKVPAVLVETGFLSNPVEDKLLATDEYQDKLADGIAGGILTYLGLQ